MKKIAIITVYNNLDLFNQMVRTVSETVDEDYCQIVGLNNTDNSHYASAAQAYNYAINNCCDAEVYVFCHQDILFLHDSIKHIYEICSADISSVYGAAGVKNIGHGGGNRIISTMAVMQEGWNYQSLARGTTEMVFSLDECLICGHSSIFKMIKFDEAICSGWHLYTAELCMQCHVKGFGVKVFDADIVHLSGGKTDRSFYIIERKLAKKYRPYFPIITYTCGWTYTDPIRYYLLHFFRRVKYHI